MTQLVTPRHVRYQQDASQTPQVISSETEWLIKPQLVTPDVLNVSYNNDAKYAYIGWRVFYFILLTNNCGSNMNTPRDNWENCRSRYLFINLLEYNGSATSNNMKLVHLPLIGGLLHLVQRGGDWAGPQPAQAPLRCTKCNSSPINGQYTNHRIAV